MHLIRSLGSRLRSPQTTSPWEAILSRDGVRVAAGEGQRVLLATGVGGHPMAPILDSLVGVALALRGAAPRFLLCDAVLPACELATFGVTRSLKTFVEKGPRHEFCRGCVARGEAMMGPLPLPLHHYSEFVTGDEVSRIIDRTATWDEEQCFSFSEAGLDLGEQVFASLARFLGKGDLGDEDSATLISVARRYAAASLVAAVVFDRALETIRPDVVVAHHGIYIPQGVLGAVARRNGTRLVNWGASYRDRTVIYSHGDTYHRTFIDEPVASWVDHPLEAADEDELMNFLARRRRGEGDWAWITPQAALRRAEHTASDIVSALGIDLERPVFGLLTNVIWDAQLYYSRSAFANMLEWLYCTIDHFAARPERQLIVRIHPHEAKDSNRQPVAPYIAARYPNLPDNIKIVDFDSTLNTYSLMELCQAVLIYGTKTGTELAPLGIPVVVAGDAWIRGKNLTIDVSSKDEYERALDSLIDITPLDDDVRDRARRYAYHFFFRRMIPIKAFAPGRTDVELGIDTLQDILPGRDEGLDVVCRGILTGAPFHART